MKQTGPRVLVCANPFSFRRPHRDICRNNITRRSLHCSIFSQHVLSLTGRHVRQRTTVNSHRAQEDNKKNAGNLKKPYQTQLNNITLRFNVCEQIVASDMSPMDYTAENRYRGQRGRVLIL